MYPAFIIRRTLYIYIYTSVGYISVNRILSRHEWNSNSLGTNEGNEIETGFAIPSEEGGEEEEAVSLIRIGTKETSSAFTVG